MAVLILNSKIKILQTIAQLQKAATLTNSNQVILRESDKKMGWSLNNTDWYKSKYIRHLKYDFYRRVGSVGQVQAVKRSCREELLNILSKYNKQFLYTEILLSRTGRLHLTEYDFDA